MQTQGRISTLALIPEGTTIAASAIAERDINLNTAEAATSSPPEVALWDATTGQRIFALSHQFVHVQVCIARCIQVAEKA